MSETHPEYPGFRKVGIHPPEGAVDLTIPARWRDDPLVQNRIYFTIPEKLFQLVVKAVGEDRFSEEGREREFELGRAIGNHAMNVGYWNGEIIPYTYLAPRRPLEFDVAWVAKSWGKGKAEVKMLLDDLDQSLETAESPIRGYVGWLLMQRAFVDEHDRLVCRYQQELHRHGFPKPALFGTENAALERTTEKEWVAEFRKFYLRWRLQTLAAPGLPMPHAVQIPDMLTSVRTKSPEGVMTFSIPDIAPTFGQGIMPDIVEDALRGRPVLEHLSGWMSIVEKDNPGKKEIYTFERRFRVQHFWRVLKQRHAEALHRKKRTLRVAFAQFFKAGEDTIRRDLRYCAAQLGTNWDERPIGLC